MKDWVEEMIEDPMFIQHCEESKEELLKRRRTGNPNGRPLKYPYLGAKKIVRVPEEVECIDVLYEGLNSLATKGYAPHSVLREIENLLTELDRIAVRQDPCELLSEITERLTEME